MSIGVEVPCSFLLDVSSAGGIVKGAFDDKDPDGTSGSEEISAATTFCTSLSDPSRGTIVVERILSVSVGVAGIGESSQS